MSEDNDLRPTWTPPGGLPELQADSMRELRRYSDEGMSGRHPLGELLLALSYPCRSLSLKDMANASRLSMVEVEEVVRERWEHHVYCKNREVADRVARHRVAA
jgi:hypothetical protein